MAAAAAAAAAAKAAVTGAATTAKAAATSAASATKAAAATAAAAVRRRMIPTSPEMPTEMKNLKANRMNSAGHYKPFDPYVAALIMEDKINLMNARARKYHRGYGWKLMFVGTGSLGLWSYKNKQDLVSLQKEFAEDT